MLTKIAKVKFNKRGKAYDYICNIPDVKVGDTVYVLARERKMVTVVDIIERDLTQDKMANYKKIMYKTDARKVENYDEALLEEFVDAILAEFEKRLAEPENFKNYKSEMNYMVDTEVYEREESKWREKAIDYESLHERERAFECYYKATLSGMMDCMSWMTEEIEIGSIVNRNIDLAIKCYSITANMGDYNDFYTIGDIYADHHQYYDAMLNYSKAIVCGYRICGCEYDGFEHQFNMKFFKSPLPSQEELREEQNRKAFIMHKVLYDFPYEKYTGEKRAKHFQDCPAETDYSPIFIDKCIRIETAISAQLIEWPEVD